MGVQLMAAAPQAQAADTLHAHWWVWAATLGGLALLLLLDLVIVDRKPHEVTTGEAARWVVFYIACAIAFGIGVWIFGDAHFAIEYFTGYITEYSLSVDNLFIFMVSEMKATHAVGLQLYQAWSDDSAIEIENVIGSR